MCECGCGAETSPGKRFIRGHHWRVRHPRVETFWSHVDISESDGCWLWLGRTAQSGYGILERQTAHRTAWELANGPVPRGLCVLHRCDTPPCCNPRHLWLGTRADNNADRARKGRSADVRGEAGPNAKLRAAQVVAIRERRAGGETLANLAKEFGVHLSTISHIVNGKSWTEV